ncbi:SDR family NAD(P)-dependent oxidoreductase [Mucilaginibacter rubeus]|uniref:SDR family NAD(P)-dependent oxidoreductase n=1 Tax=Mucilaginibacter rubeus TaxID=2027860 RepID=A0AAE6JGF8_9SPHI|nr:MULTISPECIES: SDR family NAD(P)-dependent oxidoreductase [Mucilaginibacter]QEM04981.1 SDR family NAD(P)-dependent oxidoreductase [Mucilaginibacter rubeus]QEM17575.1 SDR family NAD(P)-dependent oxidoreductase [Mucilaginibacter gossypii]QTE45904.1 SDR family NAD(P)-dependent oxidoreductase [Mucilaginibacter rubeus]QTE52501.1 SDR family NAD(P)-dependent oxidoreductase [Mucilaginibacter rubeus]QTE57590.1 SDR family NAD(P)-dependent oxidoreductase [Mucilaginibacter rubeus]
MSRIFITGSADGLGQLAAVELVKQGYRVVLHARDERRAEEALAQVPGAECVLAADLSDIDATKRLADEVNRLGRFDAIIHNAGVYQMPAQTILAVNTIAPYILTCLIEPPKRLIYLSSGDHLNGDPTLAGLRADPPKVRYADSKLHDLILAKAVARKWPNVLANALDPGWVPTKMGGRGAPDDLQKGYETQVWLAVSDDPKALVSGRYFRHQREARYEVKADDADVQEQFLQLCGQISGMAF